MHEADLGRIVKRLYSKISTHFNSQDVEWEILFHPQEKHSHRPMFTVRVWNGVRWVKTTQPLQELASMGHTQQVQVIDEMVRKLDQAWNNGDK